MVYTCKKYGKFFIVTLTILLIAAMMASSHAIAPSSTVDLIVFSDTHIGQSTSIKSGSDNLTSNQRYIQLLNSTNQLSATMMINCGDLTNGWTSTSTTLATWYQDYQQLSKTSANPIMSIKGNHDANNQLYWKYVGPQSIFWLTQKQAKGDMLLIGINSMSDNADDWLYNGTTYIQYEANFLNATINSAIWNQTNYHFMFMHFEPNSTWPIPAKFSVPTSITQYCHYFDVVFCGHEGGVASALNQQGATVIHCAHLGDGTIKTDTYLTIQIARSTHTVAVVAHNFVTGAAQPLLAKTLIHGTVAYTPLFLGMKP